MDREVHAGAFRGHARYQGATEIGRGAMGVVYRALDVDRGQPVALKELPLVGPEQHLLLKSEFRSRSGVRHRGLVELHELVIDDDACFFTMELLAGDDFVTHVRRSADPIPTLVDAAEQLALAIHELHQHDRVHRDIKPSNVLVTAQSRVVVLDFGLAVHLSPAGPSSKEQGFVGTPAYLAPEQLWNAQPSPSADWYAFGVLLYEALTGERLFVGSIAATHERKCRREFPSPRALVADTPELLDTLVMGLLDPDPAHRDGFEDVRHVLEQLGAPQSAERPIPSSVDFVGRREELDVLRRALNTTSAGSPRAIRIEGRSGVGKTRLVRHFLEPLGSPDTTVLTGRCHHRELLPFKAFDAIVDALSHHLLAVDPATARRMRPRHADALACVFPVLRRTPTFADQDDVEHGMEQQELRRKAFGAFAELLSLLAEHTRLVVWIDDLQWSDSDSGALLVELLESLSGPVFVILSYRSEEREHDPQMAELDRQARRLPERWAETLEVGPLPQKNARELAEHTCGHVAGPALLDSIVAESGGFPWFIRELSRYVSRGMGADESLRLAKVMTARYAPVPQRQRHILDLICVAAGPVESEVIRVAADAETLVASAQLLESMDLVRRADAYRPGALDVYHDKVRETRLAELDDAQKSALHRQLARGYAQGAGADPEALFTHLQAAGDDLAASEQVVPAARQAYAALAFDRAARLFSEALRLKPVGHEPWALERELADAYAASGRAEKAATHYEAAARSVQASSPETAVALHRLAAEQYLKGGFVDRGLRVANTHLRALGVRVHRNTAVALASLGLHRARLRLRGLGYELRREEDVPPAQLASLDAHLSMTIGLMAVDTIRAGDLAVRTLLLALDAGEPIRLVRALIFEQAYVAMHGVKNRYEIHRLQLLVHRLVDEQDTPEARALALLGDGLTEDWLDARWRRARVLLDEADELLRDRCTGVLWERATARTLAFHMLFFTGDIRELCRRVPAIVRDAEASGDRYFQAMAVVGVVWDHLCRDEPEQARAAVARMLGQWTQNGFHIQHLVGMLMTAEIDLYDGNGARAHEHYEAQWGPLRRSLLLDTQSNRVNAVSHRNVCRLTAARHGHRPRRMAELARRDADRLVEEGVVWGRAASEAILASLAAQQGDHTQALVHIHAAEHAYESADMALYATACKRERGLLRGGRAGATLVAAADARIAAEGIANPAAWCRMLIPPVAKS